jgi:ethanolamine utilization protein EutM
MSMPSIKSIGILETEGFVPLIEGADAAVKAANVNLIEWRKIGKGFVSFVIEGEVAAVRSAIEAGRTAAAAVGTVVSEIVIPRPVNELKTTWKK